MGNIFFTLLHAEKQLVEELQPGKDNIESPLFKTLSFAPVDF